MDMLRVLPASIGAGVAEDDGNAETRASKGPKSCTMLVISVERPGGGAAPSGFWSCVGDAGADAFWGFGDAAGGGTLCDEVVG